VEAARGGIQESHKEKGSSLDSGYWVFLLPGLVMFLLVIILRSW